MWECRELHVMGEGSASGGSIVHARSPVTFPGWSPGMRRGCLVAGTLAFSMSLMRYFIRPRFNLDVI